LQFKRQKFFIPTGIEGQLVIDQDIGSLLPRRHSLEADTGDMFKTKRLGRSEAPKSGKDHVLIINEEGCPNYEEGAIAKYKGQVTVLWPPWCLHFGPNEFFFKTLPQNP
jgi:hypothetical protein